MGSLEINRHPIHPVACLFENHVAKSANKRKIAKVCDRTIEVAHMIRKQQLEMSGQSAFQQFEDLAG
jgi:hypothetical protein